MTRSARLVAAALVRTFREIYEAATSRRPRGPPNPTLATTDASLAPADERVAGTGTSEYFQFAVLLRGWEASPAYSATAALGGAEGATLGTPP